MKEMMPNPEPEKPDEDDVAQRFLKVASEKKYTAEQVNAAYIEAMGNEGDPKSGAPEELVVLMRDMMKSGYTVNRILFLMNYMERREEQ